MFKQAQTVLTGGVNSPVRSFKGVGKNNPLFISRAKGSKIFDEDGNSYIDYVCSWGASILGSAHPAVITAISNASKRGISFGAATKAETELAEMVKNRMPSLELMRFVSSGTEATMSSVRVARAFTKRSKIIKFEGCYHGHADCFLVRAGSGLATFSIADSAGIPNSCSSETLVARFNDIRSVEELFRLYPNSVACVIVEPIAGNMGVIPPEKGFLKELKRLCSKYGAVLIFDEVITGFRVSRGGAQQLYSVTPDLTCFGKVVGGGTNIAGYGGRSDIMKLVSPLGPVYQAGTLSGNPLSVAAGIATLENLRDSSYKRMERISMELEKGITQAASEVGIGIVLQRVGSMIGLFFTDKIEHVRNYYDVSGCNRESYAKFFSSMISRGIYLPPSPFETIFLSSAHSSPDVSRTLSAVRTAFRVLTHESKK